MTNPSSPTRDAKAAPAKFDLSIFANAPVPPPWIVDEINTPNGKSYQISRLWTDEDGTHTDAIAQIEMDYAPGVALVSAEMIVRAVNAHDALVGVLRVARTAMVGALLKIGRPPDGVEIFKHIDAALALAASEVQGD